MAFRRRGFRRAPRKRRLDWLVFTANRVHTDTSVTITSLVDDILKSGLNQNYPQDVTLIGGRIHVVLQSTVSVAPPRDYRCGLAVCEVDSNEFPTATLDLQNEGLESKQWLFTHFSQIPLSGGAGSGWMPLVHQLRTKRRIPQNTALVWADQASGGSVYASVYLRLLVQLG